MAVPGEVIVYAETGHLLLNTLDEDYPVFSEQMIKKCHRESLSGIVDYPDRVMMSYVQVLRNPTGDPEQYMAVYLGTEEQSPKEFIKQGKEKLGHELFSGEGANWKLLDDASPFFKAIGNIDMVRLNDVEKFEKAWKNGKLHSVQGGSEAGSAGLVEFLTVNYPELSYSIASSGSTSREAKKFDVIIVPGGNAGKINVKDKSSGSSNSSSSKSSGNSSGFFSRLRNLF
jgi:hypothetical protein